MADPVASVEKIVKIALAIKDAVDTVRHNEEECQEIGKRVLRYSGILSKLQQTGMMSGNPVMSGALQDLEEALQHALELVTECQKRHVIRRFFTAGDLAKQLRRVKDDISDKVMLGLWALNVHTTMVLLTIQAHGHVPLHPPLRTLQDTGEMEIPNNIQSTDDSSFIRIFSLSQIKAAINGGSIIGTGLSCDVYKGVLSDKTVVAIKKYRSEYGPFLLEQIRNQLLFVPKLHHKNIVKFLGLCHEESGHIWVEEYAPNGCLDEITHGSRLDWPFVFQIIEGLAQGIRYLHEQHIVHRDVKPSNVLLDSDMNPKITDFGISMVLSDDEIRESSIAGSFQYMAPEYALEGIVSKKNDVYGFGGTLLDTVSGTCRSKPHTGISDDYKRVPYEWAWEAWEAGRIEEEFDLSSFDGSQQMELKRCVQVGLLCLQTDPEDRPTMTDVIEMLHGEKELPTPNNICFFGQRNRISDSDGLLSSPE